MCVYIYIYIYIYICIYICVCIYIGLTLICSLSLAVDQIRGSSLQVSFAPRQLHVSDRETEFV